MFLIDPLQGFTATSGYLLLQIAFAIQGFEIMIRSVLIKEKIMFFITVLTTTYCICFGV